MLDLASWGMLWWQGFGAIGEWFSRPVSSLGTVMGLGADLLVGFASIFGLGDLVSDVLWAEILPFGTVGSLLLGSGLVIALGYRLIKFFTDIVL